MSPGRRAWPWQLLLALGRAALLAASTPAHRALTGDEPVFDGVARSLLAGRGFSYGGAPWVSRSPGWAALLALVKFAFGDSVRAGVFVQGLLDAGSILLATWIARRLFRNETAAWLAFGFTMMWPPFARESRFLQTEPLFTYVLLLVVACIVYYAERPSNARAAAVGLAGGLAGLVRPNGIVPLGALAFAWMLFARPGRSVVAHAAVLVLTLALVLAPWTLRNARVFHAFIPVSSGAGELFYMGTTPETAGRWDHAVWGVLHDRIVQAETVRLGRTPTVLEVDHALMNAGVAAWRRDPGLQVRLWMLRAWRLLGVPVTGERFALRASFLAAILLVDLLAIRGAWRPAPGAEPMARGILVAVFLNAVALSVFYTNSRYFEPLRALLLVLAAGGVASIGLRRAPDRAD